MRRKHLKTLAAVLSDPPRANILWSDIESMIAGLGGDIREGAGSRVTAALNGAAATFHRPHPQKEATKDMIRNVRTFLVRAGVN